jgi:hypothetical protein
VFWFVFRRGVLCLLFLLLWGGRILAVAGGGVVESSLPPEDIVPHIDGDSGVLEAACFGRGLFDTDLHSAFERGGSAVVYIQCERTLWYIRFLGFEFKPIQVLLV